MFRKARTLLGIGFGLVLALAQMGISSAHAPSIAIADEVVYENAGSAYVRVTLDCYSNTPVTVAYATADGSAEGGRPYGDYWPASGTVTFYPGETSRYIRVTIFNDPDAELTEDFFVNLSGAEGAAIADGQGWVRIVDDETGNIP